MIFDLLLLKGNDIFFLLAIWFITANWRVIQRPGNDAERYVYDLRWQKHVLVERRS